MSASPVPAHGAPPRLKTATLLPVLAVITALGPLSMDMYLPALPKMGEQLHTSAANIQLTVAVYIVGNGLGQLVFGPLSDRFGRRAPALMGLAVFIAACVGCGLTSHIGWMLAFRFLQAVGVCSGQVIARAVLADLFEPRELARFSSLLSMITMVMPIIGPLLGGYVFTAFGWRVVFAILAVYGAVVMTVTALRLPETLSAEARARARSESAWQSYMAVLRNWPLVQMGFVGAFSVCGMFIYLSNAPHLIIEHFGVPAYQFGWYFAANSVGLFIGANVNRHVLKTYSPGQVLRWTGRFYFAMTVLLLITSHLPATGKWGVLVPLFLVIATFPTVIGNSMALAQGLDRQRAGAVAAVVGAMQSVIGGAAVVLASSFGDGTPKAMAWMMVLVSGLGAAVYFRMNPTFGAKSQF